jgi:hypothetical protein
MHAKRVHEYRRRPHSSHTYKAHPTHTRSRSSRDMNTAKKTDAEHVCASVGCEKEGSKRCGGCKKVCVSHMQFEFNCIHVICYSRSCSASQTCVHDYCVALPSPRLQALLPLSPPHKILAYGVCFFSHTGVVLLGRVPEGALVRGWPQEGMQGFAGDDGRRSTNPSFGCSGTRARRFVRHLLEGGPTDNPIWMWVPWRRRAGARPVPRVSRCTHAKVERQHDSVGGVPHLRSRILRCHVTRVGRRALASVGGSA